MPVTPNARRVRVARWWQGAIAVIIVVALGIQLGLILTGGPDPNTGETVASVGIGTRMIQTISFFTIQSNLLALVAAVTLAIDPVRDGRWWRVLRFDALLGITVTGVVFDTVLIDYVHPSGWQLVATIGLHYVAPWASVLGWLLFGPNPRIDGRTVGWACVWPVAWIVYTFVRGAVTTWYPYPFLDVDKVGYGRAALATGIVLLLAGLLTVAFSTIDRVRGRPRPQPLTAQGAETITEG